MPRSADLIHSNSQVYRVYSRRLANPADQDIFIVAARKLTAFLSDQRAYYPEAQRSIIEVLEIACNSLKNVAPTVFSKSGSLDRSAIPAEKSPLFDAFDKLANSVTPYVSLFANEEMNNRLVAFLSSVGVLLPHEETYTPPPDSPTQISAPPSTNHQVDPTPSSPIGTTPSDSVLTSGLPSTVKEPTSIQPTALPTPAPGQVLSIEVKDNGNGAVAQLTSSRQTTRSPAGESLRRAPPSRAPVSGDVVKPARVEPNRNVGIPVPSLSTSSLSSSLRIQTSSPVLRVVPQPSQKIPENTPVAPSPTSSNLTPQNRTLPSIPPSLIPTGLWVAQASQSVPPPQAQTPIQTTASASLLSTPSGQNESKPPRKRHSAGLDFLQLDLQVAREKKLRSSRLASMPQNSGSTAEASPGAVPSPSTKIALAATTASPTSTTTAGMPTAPPALTSMPTVIADAPARAPPLTVSTQAHTSAITPNMSNTTSQPQMAQTPSPSLVHRDLKQEVARIRTSGTSPRKLRITNRAPAPAPERGSSSAPIVIDEDEQPMSTPADEPMDVDAPIQAFPQTEETAMVLDPQEVRGSNRDARHEQEEKALPEQIQQNASALEVVSHYLVSHDVPSATGASGAIAMAAQSSSAPSTSVPLSFYARPLSAIPSFEPSSRSASLCDKPSGAQLGHAKDGKEQEKPAEDSVESLGPSNDDVVSGATVEPFLGHESSISTLGTAVGVTSMPKGKDTEITPAAPAAISSTAVTTGPSPAQDYPIISVLSATVGSTSPGTVTLGVRPPEKESGSETSVDRSFLLRQIVSQTPSISSRMVDVSMLLSPPTALHSGSQPLSDMDISRSSTPPIAVLETHSGGSDTTNPSADSRSVTPPSRKRFSGAGTKQVQAEELEDEMVDELAPLFGKEMKVICTERALDVPGEFTWDFTLSRPHWDRVSQWVRAPENLDLDISQALCLTLACYSKQELDPYAIQDGLARERWFENVKPVPWAKLPRNLWALINDEVTAVFPPYMSPDDLFDLSPYLRLGHNKILFTQIDGMAEYVLVLHGHRPTRVQLVPLNARWDQERHFREQVSLLSRPFIIDDW